jgi:hypothetical protein
MTCHLKQLVARQVASALASVHGQAEVLAEAIRASDPDVDVRVTVDAQGAVLQVSAPGLAQRIHGSARATPGGMVELPVEDDTVVEAVAAAMTDAAGLR